MNENENKTTQNKLDYSGDNIKIFSNFDIPSKALNIKNRIKDDTMNIKKNHKILKTVEYGNDPNFRKYMLYLNKLQKQAEAEYLEYLKEKNKKDPYLSKLNVNQKISFPDFCEKFNINSFLIDYFDYYEIQKINKKKTAELIKKLKAKLKKEKNNNKRESSAGENIDKSYSKFKRRISQINSKTIQREEKKLQTFRKNKNKNKIYIEGMDFNLIKNIITEIEENEKKYQYLCLINSLKKEKKNFYKKLERMGRQRTLTNYTFVPDTYRISHSLDKKNQIKLKKLKVLIKNRLDKNRPKTSLTLPNNELGYLNYIPNSSKYKHINYQKELIFNNEFLTKRTHKDKSKRKFNNIKTESNIYSEDYLLTKSKKIISNLNQIKSVLKRDKNYTSKTINRANTAFHRKDEIKSDQREMEKLMKDNRKNINKIRLIKEKMKDKENFHVFKEFKEMTKLTEKNVIEKTEFFSKTLNELCKEEKKENKKYHNLMKNNYYLRIQGITEDNVKKQYPLKNLENIKLSYEKIKLQIKNRYKEINNIIKRSKEG